MAELTRAAFFDTPEVIAALDEYSDACLNALEDRGTRSSFPDPVDFLKDRGITQIPEGNIDVHHTVGGVIEREMRPICPDGSDGCFPKCRVVHGEWQCVWVCRCP